MNINGTIQEYEQFGVWAQTLHQWSDEAWHTPFQAGKASTAEIIAHVRQWDRYLIHVIVPSIRKGEGMVFPDFDAYNKEAYQYANSGVTKEQLLQQFTRDRMELIGILKSMTTDELLREVSANDVTHCPHTGTPYSLFYIIQEFIEHDAHHKKQIVSAQKLME